MQDKDRGASDCDRNAICSLEWVVWAMDAAREHNESAGSARFRLEYVHYYSDELRGL